MNASDSTISSHRTRRRKSAKLEAPTEKYKSKWSSQWTEPETAMEPLRWSAERRRHSTLTDTHLACGSSLHGGRYLGASGGLKRLSSAGGKYAVMVPTTRRALHVHGPPQFKADHCLEKCSHWCQSNQGEQSKFKFTVQALVQSHCEWRCNKRANVFEAHGAECTAFLEALRCIVSKQLTH